MKKSLFISIISILAIACAKPIEEVDNFGNIVGVVYDKTVGDPIPVAQVTLDPSGKSTVTGSDGSFAFTNIKTGDYTVKVNKKGYNDGSNKVSVVAGSKSECNLLLERIPAYVTADKDVLDFGDNLTQTTLSFNIVNSSYENLSWHIDYDKSSSSFIAEVSPDKGTTPYGKTASIVVKINRDNLKAGENVSTIVVVSDNGDGSSEVKVKAIGQEKVKATLNMTGVSDIKTTSAIVSAEITFEGVPRYTERGFVYGNTQNPTLETASKVSVAVNEEKEFSYSLKGLKYGEKYYVRAFAINSVGTSYSTNQESFTTSATMPTVSMYSVDNIDADKKTALLHGSIDFPGDPAYDERGFVYSKNKNTPTLSDQYVKVEGSDKGTYEAQISNLELKTTYYARAYAKNDGGVAYSEIAIQFSLSGSSPVVSVSEATDINLEDLTAILHGSIDAVGSPKYTEKGFVYSNVNSVPTTSDKIVNVTGTTAGSYYANITGLDLDKTYYVRAYAKNESGTVYSAKTVSFSTAPTKPSVTMRAITNVDRTKLSALLQGNIDSPGVPNYTEKGFVYSATNSTPSLNDSFIKVEGTSSGAYEITLSGLSLGSTYYVRAYAINAGGTVYSSEALKFDLKGTTPAVSINETDNINLSSLTATLHGSVDEVGFPVITEKGFVYSDANKVPTTSDKIVSVTGATAGSYYANITGLALNKTYYVRAYAKNESGTVYSAKTVSFSTAPTKPSVTMRAVTNVDRTKLSAFLQGNIDSPGVPNYTEKGFVYSATNSTPSLNDSFIKVEGTSSGSYEITLSGLSLGNTYYVRAYAINAGGTVYSSDVLKFDLKGTTPIVSVSETDNVNLSELTATLHGSVDEVGFPVITEKGFVYSDVNKEPTTSDKIISVTGTTAGSYYANITGLALNKTYYVRAYAKNEAGTVYSSKTVNFSTIPTKPTVSMRAITNVDRTKLSALLQGNIDSPGVPNYTEKGFVYSATNSTPSLNDSFIKVSGTSSGSYEITLTGLSLGNTYYVRAYAINAGGTVYSSTALKFDLRGTTPVVSVSEADNINLSSLTATLHGSVDEVGFPEITERGFVYSDVNKVPTTGDKIVNVTGTSAGSYYANITGLALNKTYYVRAYAKNESGTVYSAKTVSFSTMPTKPTVTIMTIGTVDFSKMAVVFKASVDNVGIPAYTEKGFVYSASNSNPTLTNGNVIKVSGTASGYFETTATGLEYNKTYYVKAYASNPGGVSYSSVTSFNTNESLPVVVTESPTNVDAINKTAVLHATIKNTGTPEYYERGFVYSSSYQQPTVNDSKVKVDGNGTGSYDYRISGIDITHKLYARAYAINHKGVSYGESVVVFDPNFIDKGEYVEIASLGIAVQKEDIGQGSWSSMSTLCKNSRTGGYADWRLPTVSELAGILQLHEKIGGFSTNLNTFANTWWWSSTFVPKDATHFADGYKAIRGDGSEGEMLPDSQLKARAVRTIRK